MGEGSGRRRKRDGPPSGGAGTEPGRSAGPRTRGQLTAEAITGAAIRVADEEGIEALTIRRVAAEVDARPMSLYIHFESKEALLSAMVEVVIEEIIADEPLPEAWQEAVAKMARRMYAAFLAHPWFVIVAAPRPRFGPNATRLSTQMAQAISDLPLDEAQVWAALGTLTDYVLGYSLRAAVGPSADAIEDMISDEEIEAHPELASYPESLRSRSSIERFEFGLQTILDGIEKRVNE